MEQFIQDWGYIALFLYSFGGGYVGLIFAGVLSYSGDLNIYISILVSGVSNFLGDQFLFFLARKNKNYAKDMMKKYGRKIALAHIMMRKYGSFVVFIQKYIYGIKTLIPLAMGLTKYSSIKFSILNAFATVLWACIVGYLSFTAGEYILSLGDDFKYVGLAIVLVMFLLLSYVFKKIEK
ncbi:MAG: DedA family protein [Arcobacter sp.]|uniref:DedA family protein n=1 Tax=Arcobacter sp. TaxID=1872629 RepID=UPI003D06BD7F